MRRSPGESRSGALARAGKLALFLLVLVSSLGLAEAALRFTAASQGRPFSTASARERLRRTGIVMQEGVAPTRPTEGKGDRELTKFLHPYFGWDTESLEVDFDREQRMFARRNSRQALDVVILGGSVAAGFSANGRRALFDALRSDPRLTDRPMRIFHHAVAGYKQPQQLNRLGYLFTLGIVPDVVINLDGFNEVALGMVNSTRGVHPLHPSASHWARMLAEQGGRSMKRTVLDEMGRLAYLQVRSERDVESALRLGLHRTALTSELAAAWLRRRQRQGLAAHEQFMAAAEADRGQLDSRYGPAFEDDPESVIALAVEGWANASRALSGMCAARGVVYLHVLQPTLHDAGSKPLTQEERDGADCPPEWIEGVGLGYPLLRAAGAELAGAGVEFFDASRIFADRAETLYHDACHFGPAGNETLGTAIGRELLTRFPAGELPAPARGIRVKSNSEQD